MKRDLPLNNSIFIPFNCPSSKNSQRIIFLKDKNGKIILDKNNNPRIKVIRSHYTTWYVQHTNHYFSVLREEFERMIRGKPNPIRIQLLFYRQDAERCDFNNLTQVIADQMKAHVWISDDSIDKLLIYPPIKHPFFKIDDLNPGTLITIL